MLHVEWGVDLYVISNSKAALKQATWNGIDGTNELPISESSTEYTQELFTWFAFWCVCNGLSRAAFSHFLQGYYTGTGPNVSELP